MKNLTGIILAFLFVANLNAQSVYTELRDGIIDKGYESFSLLDPTMKDKEGKSNKEQAVIISDDYMASVTAYTTPDFPSVEVKKQVEHAIKHELITNDYKHKKQGGEMMVSYMVFGKDGSLTGDFTDNEAVAVDRNREYDVKKGTILISIIDKESGETVWSGFSDGALSGNNAMDDNQVIKSVSGILDRLRTVRNY